MMWLPTTYMGDKAHQLENSNIYILERIARVKNGKEYKAYDLYEGLDLIYTSKLSLKKTKQMGEELLRSRPNYQKKYASQERWRKKNTKLYTFRCSLSDDDYLIEKLDHVANRNQFIKEAIQEYLARHY